MNKITNILLLLVTLPIMLVCIIIGGDLPVEALKTTGGQLPYQNVIFWVAGGLVFTILLRRSLKRWTGMQILGQKSKFIWNQEISLERKTRVLMYNLLEAAALLSMAYGLYRMCPQGWPIPLAYGIGGVEIILFSIFGWFSKTWRIGITKKAIVLADREVKALYFLGLRKIYIHQETLHFDYKDDIQLNMPLAPVENKEEFMQILWDNLNQEKVYAEESAKDFIADLKTVKA